MKRAFAIVPAVAVAFAAALAGSGCSEAPSEEPACATEPIDPFKELMIIDEVVMNDVRAKNATAGPWSFRYAAQNLAPPGANMSEFVLRWLETWREKELNGYLLDTPNEERYQSIHDLIVCPWLKATPSNACDDRCGTCAHRELDLAYAPFRLIGIANRMDVRHTIPHFVNGEGRLIYALTDGPGDDPASQPLAMTLIFEYGLPESRSTKEWAEAWHSLGRYSAFDETYLSALEQLTDSFVRRGSDPNAPNGSALNQLRTNESVLNWIWQLREFSLRPDGFLAIAPVHNTPAEQLNNSPALRQFVLTNAEAIRSGAYEIPVSMRGGSSDALRYTWELDGVDPDTLSAFNEGTCNGCHTTNPAVDTAFHLSPVRTGKAKLSRYIYDPDGNTRDQLTIRSEDMRQALCGD